MALELVFFVQILSCPDLFLKSFDLDELQFKFEFHSGRMIFADLFTTTFSPYLLRFFTVNYALRLNITILRFNQHRFFKIRLYRKGHTVIDHSERHNF